MRGWVSVPLLTLALLAAPSAARAPGLADLELEREPRSLLAGRLEVRAPAGARDEARQESIMAAPEASARETRLVADAGDQRLVLMAWELFARAHAGFEAAVRDTWPAATVEPFAPADGLRGWLVQPATLDASREAVEVARVVAADAAGLVTTVVVYVNPVAARADEEGVRRLAREVLASLRPGPRRLDLSAREQTLERLEDGSQVRVTLPAGWSHHAQPGPDFTVHWLRPVIPFGQAPPDVGLYVGGHPSWLHEREAAAFAEETGALQGGEGGWRRWTDASGAVVFEVMLPVGAVVGHVWVRARPDDTRLAEARSVAGSIRVER